jgi:ketosteroid isomerase-like protein
MKEFDMTRWICALFISLGLFSALKGAENSVPADLQQASKDYDTASRKTDAKMLNEILAEDFRHVDGLGIVGKTDYIKGMTSSPYKIESTDVIEEPEYRVFGDTAIETARTKTVLTDSILRSEKPIVSDIRYTNIWNKRAGRWWLVSEHVGEVFKTAEEQQGDAKEIERSKSPQAKSKANLEKIWGAVGDYYAIFKHYPLPSSPIETTKKGPPISWRVRILPFLEEWDLYRMYREDLPWDSAENKRVLEKMPSVFRAPGDDSSTTNSSYFVFAGPDTMFGKDECIKMKDVRDGTSHTIMVVEAKRAVPWTKPEDIEYDAQMPLPKIEGWSDDGFNVVFGGEEVALVRPSTKEKVLRALITRADLKPIGPESLPTK